MKPIKEKIKKIMILVFLSISLTFFSSSEAAPKGGKKIKSKSINTTKSIRSTRKLEKTRKLNSSAVRRKLTAPGSSESNGLLMGLFLGSLLFGNFSEDETEINLYNKNFIPPGASMQEIIIIANRKGWKLGAIKGILLPEGTKAKFCRDCNCYRKGGALFINEAPKVIHPDKEIRIINIEFYWDDYENYVVVYFIWKPKENPEDLITDDSLDFH